MRLSGTTMGTDWSVSAHASPGVGADAVRSAVESGFARIISEMSTWEPDSLINRFNRLPIGDSLVLPEDFRQVLDITRQVAAATDGALNPCLGADVSRLGFGSPAIPLADQATDRDAWRTLALVGPLLTRHAPFQLDLSAIAKGYAVDGMGDALRALGITSFLAEIGGEFTAGGAKPDGLPWWVDFESPAAAPPWRVALCNLSLATSGDYRKLRIENGQRVSHIVSHPNAIRDDGALANVSVLHASCAFADAWATGLFASGASQGLDLANRHGIAALFQFRDQPAQPSIAITSMLA